jgi:hypothetical protein
MRTVEELEAQLEGARVMVDSLTRSLELAEAELAVVRQEFRAWKDATNLTTQQLIELVRHLGNPSCTIEDDEETP